jgi:hypothetical protein
MRRPSSLICSLLLVLSLFVIATGMPQPGWAQEVTASITGTVTDPSGAAVAGAKVTTTSAERGITYMATTFRRAHTILKSKSRGLRWFRIPHSYSL